jgi:hypothetical protein
MATLVLDRDAVVARLSTEAQPLKAVLDQLVERSETPRALRTGRKGHVLSRAELIKGQKDHARLTRVLEGVPEDGSEMIVMIQHAAHPFLNDPAWQGHPVVTEISSELLALASLIAADPLLADPSWEIREQVAHIVDLLDTLKREIERSVIDDPRLAAEFVVSELESVDQREVAHLLGFASDRSLRDIRAGKTREIRKHPERVILVAQLVYDLRHAMRPNGILAWFRRSRSQLGGKAPIELITSNPNTADEPLRALARGVRGQLAT